MDTKLQSILTTASFHDLLPSRKKTPISMNEMLAGPHRLSACFWRKEISLNSAANRTVIPQTPSE
jgi:hypothetical protein